MEPMEFEVATYAALHAAIRAAAQPTFEQARQNPVRILFGTTRMTFREGISEIRAKQLIRNSRELRNL